jgi:hypothetical protein
MAKGAALKPQFNPNQPFVPLKERSRAGREWKDKTELTESLAEQRVLNNAAGQVAQMNPEMALSMGSPELAFAAVALSMMQKSQNSDQFSRGFTQAAPTSQPSPSPIQSAVQQAGGFRQAIQAATEGTLKIDFRPTPQFATRNEEKEEGTLDTTAKFSASAFSKEDPRDEIIDIEHEVETLEESPHSR